MPWMNPMSVKSWVKYSLIWSMSESGVTSPIITKAQQAGRTMIVMAKISCIRGKKYVG